MVPVRYVADGFSASAVRLNLSVCLCHPLSLPRIPEEVFCVGSFICLYCFALFLRKTVVGAQIAAADRVYSLVGVG